MDAAALGLGDEHQRRGEGRGDGENQPAVAGRQPGNLSDSRVSLEDPAVR
jgi:hypothetical protein